MRNQFVSKLLALFFIVSLVTPALSAKPWDKLRRRKPSLEKRDLQLSEDNGPWLIYAASFAGDGAKMEAEKLAVELRRKHKLAAYVHSQRFDFSKSVNGAAVSRAQARRKMRYKNGGAFDEIAVLVGDFQSVDDPNLQKTLKQIKYTQPDTIARAGNKTTRRFAGLRDLQKRINGSKEKKSKGPMGMAFATPNPLMPREAYAPSGIDSFVVKMNKNVEHSLLDCPKKYTVKVATFRGSVVTNQQKVQEIKNGGHMKSQLEQAALKAHKLTELLRRRNVEAYEFHDRHESYVTVGSFDWVGQPRADGRQEINPAVHKIMKQFEASQSTNGIRNTVAQPKRLGGISFDAKPWPVEVPRPSLAKDYSASKLFLR